MYEYLLNQNSNYMDKILDNNNKTANDYLLDKNNKCSLSISNIITSSYKNIEKSIIYYLESKNDFKFKKCMKCNNIIDFTDDICNIINYAFTSYDYVLINMILKSFQYRYVLNNVYSNNENENNLLSINNRHKHIVNMYKSNLEKYDMNIDNYVIIID